MKRFMMISILAALPVMANARIDYAQGYCVPSGAPLDKQNAILTVHEGIANGRAYIRPKQHMFFSPYSMESLTAVDWGGMLTLTKSGEVNGHVSIATIESTMHSISIEKQIVNCVADGAEEL